MSSPERAMLQCSFRLQCPNQDRNSRIRATPNTWPTSSPDIHSVAAGNNHMRYRAKKTRFPHTAKIRTAPRTLQWMIRHSQIFSRIIVRLNIASKTVTLPALSLQATCVKLPCNASSAYQRSSQMMQDSPSCTRRWRMHRVSRSKDCQIEAECLAWRKLGT